MRLIGATFLAGLMVLGPVPAQATLEPYQLVRSFQRIQDQIVQGDKASISMQRALFDEVAKGLAEQAENAPSDDRNLRSILVFALAGGGRSILRPYAPAFAKNDKMRVIAQRIFNYNGRNAATVFKDVDVEQLDNLLGASIALVRGQEGEDIESRRWDLNYARTKAPGTVIEEGALRRLAKFYRQQGEVENFYNVSKRYVRTYINSPFFSQFVEELIVGAIAMDSSANRQKLKETLDIMEEGLASRVRDRIIRIATIGKKQALYEELAAVQRSIETQARTNKFDAIVLRAYNSIGSLNPEIAQDVIDELNAIDPRDLSFENRRLRLATVAAIRAIYNRVASSTRIEGENPMPSLFPERIESAAGAQSTDQADDELATSEEDAALIDSIRSQLEDADRLLEGLDD